MTGLCVEGHAHLSQTTRDLDGIAMRMRNEAIELFVCVTCLRRVWCREGVLRTGQLEKEEGLLLSLYVFVSLGVKGGVECMLLMSIGYGHTGYDINSVHTRALSAVSDELCVEECVCAWDHQQVVLRC